MNLYVGVTDRDWFQFLRSKQSEEMNFWRPRSTMNFEVLVPGELFLFKMKFPENRIAGGAYFVRHTVLPLDMAWEVFGESNGCISFDIFRRKISSLRGDDERNPKIGCTVLTEPFYLSELEYWTPPSDWSPNIVKGKRYDVATAEGRRLFELARIRTMVERAPKIGELDEPDRYGDEQLIKPRLGQAGFRVVVLDEYERRCAVTGERTLPVLQAAHIQPYAEQGPHEICNGLLLRSDLHALFDRGYVTVTNDLRLEVSKRIREEFSNGREYYAYHGKELMALPKLAEKRPAKAFLEWHQANRFLAG